MDNDIKFIKQLNTYPSKLLLFGEHTVVKGSQALALPYPSFHGQWEYGGEAYDLADLAVYLSDLQNKGELLANIDTDTFQKAVAKGLNFKSNIPTGYGLGSSGALCAGLYAMYGTASNDKDLLTIKKELAQIESFFHGSSSGIDPLVSYLQQGVWIKSSSDIQLVNTSFSAFQNDYVFFLVDTHITRKTAPLVQVFHETCQTNPFNEVVKTQLVPSTNQAITAFLEAKPTTLFHYIHEISTIQYKYLRPLIPNLYQHIWQQGIESNYYKLKLCGAGGGGFILGYTNDLEKTKANLQGFAVQRII